MNYNKRNYRILVVSEAVAAISSGFSIPFFLIFFLQFGGSVGVFGTSIAIQGIFASIAGYQAGKMSDKVGRKPIMIVTSIVAGIFVVLYAMIGNIWQLYILQACVGIAAAMYSVGSQTFLADITKKINRGKDIGKYHMVIGISTALSTLIGGFFVEKIAFDIIFIFVGIVFIIDTIPLFYLRENKKS